MSAIAPNEFLVDHFVSSRINDSAAMRQNDLSMLDINAGQMDSDAEVTPAVNSSISLPRRISFLHDKPDDSAFFTPRFHSPVYFKENW